MRDVLAFAGFAQPIAFDGFGEDDGRAALVLDGGFVGGINFARIVTAAAQTGAVLRRSVCSTSFSSSGYLPKKLLADVSAGFDDVASDIRRRHFAHPLDEQAARVARENADPIAAPDNFDDIPAGAAEGRFELLNDLAVAANRAIQPLQVAVDDEDEVVELFARGKCDRAERFRLVGFAVAEECPDFASVSASIPRSSR